MRNAASWGRFPVASETVLAQRWRGDSLPQAPAGKTLLPYGLGRSYGDSCLNDGQAVVATRLLRRLISFDAERGVLRCEAGTSLAEILEFAIPRGWFLPVTPGTRFVTVGGAVANDVHGKNHHVAGNFGRFVNGFELLRSCGGRQWCSRRENAGWFHATVGGLGLTGLITQAEGRLKPIRNRLIDCETIRYGTLEEFFALSLESEPGYEYLVAWVDATAKGSQAGRGLLMRGNHNGELPMESAPAERQLRMPFDFPGFVINRYTIQAFNTLYFRRQRGSRKCSRVDLYPFFYPLDSIAEWNRMYGRSGFLQWQCLVPLDRGPDALREILESIGRSGQGSFLAVMKTMGGIPPEGNLTFSGRGVTLALDLRNAPAVFSLLERLDRVVAEAGGKLYPAKDARMSAAHFQRFYPNWNEHCRWMDPAFSSSFWRRVSHA
jgi:FAD/FMN-containing dehydrogenase